jgi:ADP-ribose pyrophosphatase YjhB (NUDIX family)
METDESPEVAIARELREETGDAFAAAVMAVGLRRLADIGSLAAFVAEVPAEALQALELGGEFTGEVLQLSLDDLSHVRAADRTIDKPGVPPGSWVMFADHLQLAQQVLA